MKKFISILSISFLLIITAACSNNKVNGKGENSTDVPIKWVNALIQTDESKMLNLLNEKSKALDPKDKADNKETIKHYKLTQWEVNDKDYFYKIEYQDPTDKDRLKTEEMEVVKTDNGWKRTKYGDIYDFDKLVKDLNPKVLRELHD
ncbi:hypothetical protein [Bacillus sp. EB600]|uniref:hypothetical protein n=1 Tax=Bacillus sp. EB600 TaxID=2806345 RepID=UPI00210B1E5B|nr:hypothetical protein [Bacillus sp. EB600]MCQ6281090.1 hypothetical protein [Bacillus sp. EB600]